jgi:signal transduction histidine kinase
LESERSRLRLQHLYDISKVLTQFESAERTLPDVLALVDRALPLRSAIFIIESAGGPRAVTWQTAGERAERLNAAQDHAQTAYRYLVRSGLDVRRDSSPPFPLSRRAVRGPESEPASPKSFVILPLVISNGSIFGALQIESARRPEEPDLAFLNAVVNQLAVAVDRHAVIAAKQESAEARERHQRCLAEATAILSTSLDYRNTLAAVVRLMVSNLADVCLLDEVMGDGHVQRLEVAFADESMRSLSEQMKHMSPSAGWPSVVKEVLSTGKARLIEEATTEDFAFERAMPINPKSWLVVPLLAHGRTLGALTLIAVGPRRRCYAAPDLAFAEELAGRAGLAVDNARLYEEAQRAVRSRDDLLAVVSHDLRSPLNAISLCLSTLRVSEDGDRRQSRGQLATIERATNRISRLIDDLLDAASIEAGHLSVEQSRVAVGPLVSEAIDSLQSLAAAESVLLKAELPSALPDVFVDEARLQQVLANLLGNAIKFTPAGGAVAVMAEPTGQTVTFAVTDMGAGISEDDLPHVFERFWQARPRARLGAGLGLFIVKGIVEAHGGKVWAESGVGQGSTFFFALPVAPGGTTEREATRVATAGGNSPHLRERR